MADGEVEAPAYGAPSGSDVKYDQRGQAYIVDSEHPGGIRAPYLDRPVQAEQKPITYTPWPANSGYPPGTLRGSDGNAYTPGKAMNVSDSWEQPNMQQGGPTPYMGDQSGGGGAMTSYQSASLGLQAQQQQRQYEQQMAELQQRAMIEANNLTFLKDKDAYARKVEDKKLTLDTQQQMFSQQQTVAGLQFQMASLQSQRDAMNAQSQQEADRFNAQQGFAVQQANAQNAQRKQEQLQGLAKDIGVLGADPGDRAKLASTILANSGWGQSNTATAGASFITPESLMPLDALLHNRENVRNQPDNPFSFTPIQARSAGPINFGNVTMPGQSQGFNQNATTTWMPGSQPAQTAQDGTQTAGGFSWSPTGTGGIQAAEEGGFLGGAYISGEAGPEINIPLGGGQTLVLNEQQAKQHGLDLKAMMKGGQTKMASGGIFDPTPLSSATPAAGGDLNRYGTSGSAGSGGLYGGADLGDQTLAKDFLNEASTRARSGTPWQTGTLPTSVYASSPGFNPLVASLLASITAQSQGIPADFFLQQAQLYRPTGANQHVVGRTR